MDHKKVFELSQKAISGLTPKNVFKHFLNITQVPRESKKETKIVDFLKKWIESNKFKYVCDEVGNLVVYIPESEPKYKNSPTVCLQGHVDMVCEKTPEKNIDFEKDPIEIMKVSDENGDEWLTANGTSLGADNGIGVAAGMAIAEDKTLKHGPIELLFTVDEETGLTGAAHLKSDVLKSQYLLNLDSEDRGTFTVGCAGGVDTGAYFDIDFENIPKDFEKYKIELTGLNGGHSGCDIHIGKGNSIKLMGRLLHKIEKLGIKYYISNIKGGSKRNAIPRDATTHLYLEKKNIEKLKNIIKEFVEEALLEYKTNDGGLKVFVHDSKKDINEKVFTQKFTNKLIQLIYAVPHGVFQMSPDIKGLVETSTNLATIEKLNHEGKEKILIYTSQRSSVGPAKDACCKSVASVLELGGGLVINTDGYPGWKPNMSSKLLKKSVETYKKMYNQEPIVEAIHAGLECGLISGKYPKMDMISFGPTIKSPHCPSEKMLVKDVQYLYDLTAGILENLL